MITIPDHAHLHGSTRWAGITAGAVAEASARDVEVQGDYGVEVMTYWVDEERGNAFLGRIHDPGSTEAKSSTEHSIFYGLARRSIHDFGELKVENHDEVLASFASVTNAVECALNMQESIRIQNTCTIFRRLN